MVRGVRQCPAGRFVQETRSRSFEEPEEAVTSRSDVEIATRTDRTLDETERQFGLVGERSSRNLDRSVRSQKRDEPIEPTVAGGNLFTREPGNRHAQRVADRHAEEVTQEPVEKIHRLRFLHRPYLPSSPTVK
ncbi:hypothetical protein HRbin27_01402 [bacterium HR27]|nr:hypothetical protein HRbin27_01402 [bacterium HR27]